MSLANGVNPLQRFFRLRQGEVGLVFVMGLVLFMNALAQQVSEITAISNFLSEGGVNQILVVWAVDSVMILLTMGVQSLIVDRFGRISLVSWLIFVFAIAFFLMRWLYSSGAPEWLIYALLYLLATQQLVFFPMIFWILANDIFDVAQATRLFPLITSFGFMGKLLGIGVSLAVPSLKDTLSFFRPEGLLMLEAIIYLVTYLLFFLGMRKVKIRQTSQVHETVKETLTEGWAFVREVPAFKFLALSIMMLLACDVAVEFRFLVVSDQVYTDPSRYQVFYALYRLGLTVASILIQSLLTSRIIAHLNIKNSFLVKPIGVLLGSIWVFVQANLMGAVGGALMLRLTQYTIDEPTRKAFQSLVPEERRGRVSIFMESYLYFLGTLLGCLGVGAIVFAGIRLGFANYSQIYLGLSILGAIISIWAILKMRRVYDSSLLNWRLKRRQRGKSVLDRLEF
ncbi:MAG: hypothetical protein JXB15_02705 [Anaerolineales bacterium]|nr:hypothetical protein [Anaerolineales bacterium]